MSFSIRGAAKMASLLTVGALALTGCTNASEANAGTSPSGSSSAPAFDPGAVAKNDSLAAEVPSSIRSRGSLIVATTPTYAPAAFLGGPDNQTPMGYDIDLAKAIAAKLGLEVEVEGADFPSILPALGSKYDLGIASFTINQKRLGAVNFVSYMKAGTLFAVQKGNPRNFSLDDVCGRSIGVQTGTIQEEPDLKNRNEACIAAGKKPIDLVSLKTQTDITTRLVNGSIEAMAADSPVTGYAIQLTNGALEKVGSPYDTAALGIAVAKNDIALTELVKKVVQDLISDGTYAKILETWNNADAAIEESEVNPSVTS
ncbi:amino acid ABC transporter substrate-binding protein, PAAT family (TC 3.A.1.3.-) [Arthrobacter sp. 31Cvi3.1E]|nr:amino acid ABC transporter substrate-binding protein, PAAT family (TC 3.A.1.3.-) [Arthrobacter sp. 31Cvi3.1E]